MKRRMIRGLLLALLCLLAFSACTDGLPTETETPSRAEETTDAPAAGAGYSVTVADYFGNGIKDVIVKIMQNGDSVAMKVTGEDGKVFFKIEDGEYGVELDFPSETTRASYEFDTSALKLTPDAPALTVTLYNVYSETEGVQGYSHERNATIPRDAYKISEGAYRLQDLNTADRTYFLFRPTRSGIYHIRVISDARFEFGYYGGNLNGSKDSLLPVENKMLELEIRSAYIGDSEATTTPYLIGVMPKSESVTDCLLVVERVGEPAFSPVDVEWRTVLPGVEDLKRINYLNWTFSGFTSVDIKANPVSVIFNEVDGFYHFGTADGPIVYIRLNTASGYLGDGGTIYGAAEMSQFGAHFYDEEGNFLYKETYNQLIFDYTAICDPVNGACPLTKQLVYVMETMGAWKGWFNSQSGNYLFGNVAVNPDMMPFFACGYYKTVTKNTSGSEANPVKLGADTNGAILVQKGTPIYLKTTAADLLFEIVDANGDLKVTYNGKTYVAVDGKITLPVSSKDTVIKIEVLSNSSAESVAAVIVEKT